MLTVVTPASSLRLTTVARTRTVLGTPQDDDAQIGILIDQASAAAASFCRCQFARETVKESFVRSRAVTGSDGGLLLSRTPVVAIASITNDGALLDPADYEFDPLVGVLFQVAGCGRLTWGYGGPEVVYVAGYSLPSDGDGTSWTLPASIERAAILLVAAYRSSAARDPLIKSESVDGVSSTSWWVPGAADTLPDPEAERLLRPYRRILLG